MSYTLLFPGQGAQIVGMGKKLYEKFPCVKRYFDIADKNLPFPLTSVCFEGPEEVLKETRVCQPALYVMGYSIFALLRENNVSIKSALGLSLGELTALACADVYDFETGLHLVAERGRLMQEACDLVPTGMLSLIGGSPLLAKELSQKFDLDISNLNCPGQTVVSGTLDNITQAQQEAKSLGFKLAIVLKVAGAYHSRWMQPAREKFEKVLEQYTFRHPKLTVLSNTTGTPITDPSAIREALGKQITSTVLWESCMRWLLENHHTECLECGPQNVLAGLAKRTDSNLHVNSLNDWEPIQTFLKA